MDASIYALHYELEDVHWWFVARRTIVMDVIGGYASEGQNEILDVGCGTGLMLL